MEGILDKLISLWNGNIVEFSKEQIVWVLENQNGLNINTLMIQQNCDGRYVCNVDQVTVKAYTDFSVEESQI